MTNLRGSTETGPSELIDAIGGGDGDRLVSDGSVVGLTTMADPGIGKTSSATGEIHVSDKTFHRNCTADDSTTITAPTSDLGIAARSGSPSDGYRVGENINQTTLCSGGGISSVSHPRPGILTVAAGKGDTATCVGDRNRAIESTIVEASPMADLGTGS